MASLSHSAEVARRCRVCGKLKKPSFLSMKVSKVVDNLLVVFGLDVREDEEETHPTRICRSCYSTVKRFEKETVSGKPRETSIKPFEWSRCGGEICSLCDRWRQERHGLRPGKSKAKTTKRGRPSAEIFELWRGKSKATSVAHPEGEEGLPNVRVSLPQEQATHLDSWKTDAPLDPTRFVSDVADEFVCPICKDVLDKPMEVPLPSVCQHPCCQECWEEWLSHESMCPVCRRDVKPEDLQPASRHFLSLLGSMQLQCQYRSSGCDVVLKLCDQRAHVERCQFASKPPLSSLSKSAASQHTPQKPPPPASPCATSSVAERHEGWKSD